MLLRWSVTLVLLWDQKISKDWKLWNRRAVMLHGKKTYFIGNSRSNRKVLAVLKKTYFSTEPSLPCQTVSIESHKLPSQQYGQESRRRDCPNWWQNSRSWQNVIRTHKYLDDKQGKNELARGKKISFMQTKSGQPPHLSLPLLSQAAAMSSFVLSRGIPFCLSPFFSYYIGGRGRRIPGFWNVKKALNKALLVMKVPYLHGAAFKFPDSF